MAGHSHWKQIKEKKGSLDKKRGRIFSKLLKAVAIAARGEANPDFNPRLKAAIERAKQYNVPQENIERAISKISAGAENLEEIIIEAYGPGGTALIIEAVTDNKQRTIQEVKNILKDYGSRLGEPGSVLWSFEKKETTALNSLTWQPKFKQEISKEDNKKLKELVETLENHDDIQKVYVNV
jgi:YebC/PmpR family DNA-binding regulatory protein